MRRVRPLALLVVAGCSFRHGTTPVNTMDVDAGDVDAPADAAHDASSSLQHVQTITAISSGFTVTARLNGVVAGDFLVGGFRGGGNLGVSDDANGAWTAVPDTTGSMYVFYLVNSHAAATLTITLTAQQDAPLRIVADEFSGIAATSALDQSSSSQTTTTAPSWTAPATTAVPAGELVYAAVGNFNNGEVFYAGTTNGVAMIASEQVGDGTNGVSFTEYALATAAGPQNASASVSPSIGMAGVQATFRTR